MPSVVPAEVGSVGLSSSWLAELRKTAQTVTLEHPIWIRTRLIHSGPTLPPEYHPHCEFCSIQSGQGNVLVGREQIGSEERAMYYCMGAAFRIGFHITEYPFKFIAIHFLPSVLFEVATPQDAARILHRFAVQQALKNRVVRPSTVLRQNILSAFERLNDESDRREMGWETRLRIGLVEMLLQLWPWEMKTSSLFHGKPLEVDWSPLERALTYLRAHVAEPIYARELSIAVGLSQSGLKEFFREALGTSWSRYLQIYRIRLAAAKLCQPGKNITDVALDVGFENLSHFNVTFRSFMGVTPRDYVKKAAWIKSMADRQTQRQSKNQPSSN